MLSFVTAVLSYVFGMGAIVLLVLYRLEVEATIWPAVICFALGVLSTRGSLVCLDQAMPPRAA